MPTSITLDKPVSPLKTNSGPLKQNERPMPRGPIFGWASFKSSRIAELGSVEKLANKQFTTSGRAAIYHALSQLQLPAGSQVQPIIALR